jgi:hypothetical protein
MEKSIPASGGRLEVKFEEYVVGGQGQRIPRPVALRNVVATLKGTDENDDRTHKIPAVVNGIQEGDLPEYVDYEYVRKNAGINLATIANLALAPYEPVNCGIVVSGLTNKTTLRWEAHAKGPEPSGYYILMRETFQPLWEKKIFVKGTEVTLPYSKDNYFFGIQSVDASGHESLPVFPGQARRAVSRNSK